MSLWESAKAELIDIIEWSDESSDTLVWKFPRFDNEIKQGAQLIVRQSQAAIFVNMGKIADVFGPGMHRLTTNNLPVLSTLRGCCLESDALHAGNSCAGAATANARERMMAVIR